MYDDTEDFEGSYISSSPSLLLRIFEYIKETPELVDADLHELVEIMTYLSSDGSVIGMNEYDLVVGNETHDEYTESENDDFNESFTEFLENRH